MSLLSEPGGWHEPKGWNPPLLRSGPGVHQIRLYDGRSVEEGKLVVACACRARLALISPGGDCWGPYRAHEAGRKVVGN